MSPHPDHRLYNSRIIDTYLRLLRKSYPQVEISALLNYSGMKPYQTVDPGHWFSQEQVDRFYDKLVELSKNPDIAVEAGQYAASADALGPFRHYLLSMLGPSNAFAFISKAASRLTRSASYTSRRLGPRKVEVNVRPYPGIEEKEFQCANRLGWFQAAVHLFDQKIKKIEHPQCLFRGDAVCRYVISWTNDPINYWKKLRNLTFIVLPPLFAVSFISSFPISPLLSFLGGGLIISLLALFAEFEDKIRLREQIGQIRKETEKTLHKISTNYDNALLTNEIGRALGQETTLQSILDKVVELISQRTDFDRVMVFLPNQEESCLEFHAGNGFSEMDRSLLQDLSLPIDPSHRGGLVARAYWEQESVLVENLDEMKDAFSSEGFRLVKQLGAETFLCCPIVCKSTSLGILAADKKTKDIPLLQTDLSLMDAIAGYIGIALRNADLLDGMERQLKQIQKKDGELAKYRENLEDLISVRTTQLQEALHYAEDANNAKSEFLANMSHEIRTPLTINLTALDILNDSNPREDQSELLKMAADSSHTLLALINDILDLSKIEARKLEIHPQVSSIRTCLEKTVSLFTLEAERKGLRFALEIDSKVPDAVYLDPERLHQVLANLIGNAVKFTERGRIIVGVEPDKKGLKFYVGDTGIGIPQDKLDQLFESFTQVDASLTRKYGGTGLGLAISKGLVELMGGEIWVESCEDEGSVFYFTLPMEVSEPSDDAPKHEISSKLFPLSVRILLVEDDPQIRQMVSIILNQWNCEVTPAENGEEALRILEQSKGERYDLILLDLRMPGMGGIETTRIIREKEPEADTRTPIVAITAHALREDEQKCLAVCRTFRPENVKLAGS